MAALSWRFARAHAKAKNGWDVLQPYLVEVKPDGAVAAPVAVPDVAKTSIARPVACADKTGRVWVAWNGDHGIALLRGRKS